LNVLFELMFPELGGEKTSIFDPQNGVKSCKNRSQKRRLVAKRLRNGFWTEKWRITPRGSSQAGPQEGGGGWINPSQRD